MKHGNQKYDFTPLEQIGGETTVKPANLYSLKASLRHYFSRSIKVFEFTEERGGHVHIKRIKES